ncbi:MAG TPA: MFS transporter [Candidatus Limnocylindrales bacterium]|nr:MFS transporter [Candidatus Limnocylindrales bacterium]
MNSSKITFSFEQARLLAVLALINFVNYADRQVLNPLLPSLRTHFNVSDTLLGSLQGVLLVVLALASIPSGYLADRFNEPKIIAGGVLLWSVAAIGSGLAPTFAVLLFARGMVGIGEAAYAPAAQSLISDSFRREYRAMAQSIFAAGMILGGVAGLALGGIMGERHGWQHAFVVVGLLGVLPGLTALTLKEPQRRPRSEVVPVMQLLRVPAFLTMIIAGICITFSSVSFVTWGIDYAKSYKDFSTKEASLSLAIIALITSVIGALTAGYLADRLQKRFTFGRILVIAFAFLAAAPFLLLAIQTEEKWLVLAGFSVSMFFMSWYHGPTTAVLHDLTPQRAHATAVGVYMFSTGLFGALGPLLIGKVSDVSDLQMGLQAATAVMVFGALLLLLVIYFVRRDGLHHPCLAQFRAEDEALRASPGPNPSAP